MSQAIDLGGHGWITELNVQVAGSYAALAALLRAAGRRGEALTYAHVAREAKQRAFPANHPEVAAAMLALADTLRDHARQAIMHHVIPRCWHFQVAFCADSVCSKWVCRTSSSHRYAEKQTGTNTNK